MMLIRCIALWNRDGEVRRIDLGPGLNIITGESQTGKSTLIDIANFCLGANTIRIPAGPIASTVAYYGMSVRIGETDAFFGRPGVTEGNQTSAEAQLEVGIDDLPEFADLAPNTNTAALREWIGRAVGIEENRFDPPAGATRQALVASLPHALIHCFQRQDEIASRAILFHRQGEPFLPQAIKDTLPYFLGVSGPDQLRLGAQLREAKRALTRVERAIRDLDSIREDGLDEALGLLSQAAEAGLISVTEAPEDLAGALEILTGVRDSPIPPAPFQPPGEEFDRLQTERRALGVELRSLREQRALAEAISQSGDSAREEGIEQVVRLQQIGVLHDPGESDVCPVCEQELEQAPPTVAQLRDSLAGLEEQISSVERDRPGLVGVVDELGERQASLTERLQANRLALDELAAGAEAVAEHQGRLDLGAWVRGRIDHFLEQASGTEEGRLEELGAERVRLEERVSELEETLDPARVREAATSILVRVGTPMTEMARALELEHAETGVRIDLNRLTVVADTPGGPVYMDTGIGSAKNWVGYHLAATLSLQRQFVTEERPVPSFLVLDQPSQAFFPSDLPGEEIDDQDRRDALAQFTLIRDVVEGLDSQLQVIVLDHADFDEDWFQDAVRQRWRDGEALIPQSWIDVQPQREEGLADSEEPDTEAGPEETGGS
jgi:hypothetical protein